MGIFLFCRPVLNRFNIPSVGSKLSRKMLKFTLVLILVASCHGLPRWRKMFPHIVGGEPAIKNELPYQVSFQYFNEHSCGGTIVSADTIVTAAHCIFAGYEEFMTVVAGDHTLYEDDGTEQERRVSKAIVHEAYSEEQLSNDIALLILSEPLTLNGAVKVLPLAPEGHDAAGNALISGWGDLEMDGPAPETLQKILIPIISDDACRASYGATIIDSMICAGVPQGGKDSCQGDSGGPFVADDLGYKYLAGIVSWGNGCALPDYPGVYTEVAYFAEWVAKNMAQRK